MLEQFDQNILLFFNGYHTPWLDSLMMTITNKWTWVPFYLLLVILLFIKCGWKRTLIYLIGIAVMITLCDQMCGSWIRNAVERLRPCAIENPFSAFVHTVNDYRPGSFSFPSCHAANAFAFATFMSLVIRNKWFTATLYIWSTIICITGLYLGVHYPSDLIVGAIIGALIALIIYIISNKATTTKHNHI